MSIMQTDHMALRALIQEALDSNDKSERDMSDLAMMEFREMLDRIAALEKDLQEMQEFHPRAVKLMKKKKYFVVVADDEDYFEMVYNEIRSSETLKGTWMPEDERIYRSMMGRLLIRHGAEMVGKK